MHTVKDLEQLFHTCMPSFIALGDEVRLSIIEALGRATYEEQMTGTASDETLCISTHTAQGLNVNEITRLTNLSRPAISHHLKILKDAGMIDMYQSGTSNYYYLTLKEGTKNIIALGSMLEDFID